MRKTYFLTLFVFVNTFFVPFSTFAQPQRKATTSANSNPANVRASDGEYPNCIFIEWIPQGSNYKYHIFRQAISPSKKTDGKNVEIIDETPSNQNKRRDEAGLLRPKWTYKYSVYAEDAKKGERKLIGSDIGYLKPPANIVDDTHISPNTLSPNETPQQQTTSTLESNNGFKAKIDINSFSFNAIVKVNASFDVTTIVKNSSNQIFKGTIRFSLINSSQKVPLSTKPIIIEANESERTSISLKLPPTIKAGTYQLLMEIIDTSGKAVTIQSKKINIDK